MLNRMGKPEDVEMLDTTPVEMPLGFGRPTPLQDMIANMVRQAVELEKGEEFESPEESDDFEEEDPDLLNISRYTLQELDDETPMTFYERNPATAEDNNNQTGDPPDQNAVETE